MAIRCFAQQTVIAFIYGAEAALIPPPAPTSPGNQPPDEKALGFPQLLAFHVEYSQTPLTDFTEKVDERTQP
jgi:hypothetical protein